MPGDTAPSLTITTRDSGRTIRLVNDMKMETDFALQDSNVVLRLGATLAEHLQTFRNGFDQVPESSVAAAAERLDELAKAARNFLATALAGDFAEIERLVDFVRESCPGWANGDAPPVVHIVNPLAHHLPWEILPLFHWRGRMTATTVGELAEQARMFLGFGARIERQFADAIRIDSVLDSTGHLPIRVLYDASYEGAHDEVTFFRSLAPRVHLDGPYPQAPVEAAGEPTVGQQLRNPTVATDGSRRDRPDQIVHFSCHCEASSGQDWEKFVLRFASDPASPRPNLTLATLMSDMIMAEDWTDPDRSRRMPLVFLNACGTSVVDPQSAVSMMTPFVKNANRGVIATSASIPDRVAALFSRWFYTKLLSGRTVAESLHAARRDLLVTYANPLGVLYAYYGSPSLRVHPVNR